MPAGPRISVGIRILADFYGMRGRNGDSLNLHAIWDSAILDRGKLVWPDSAVALTREITAQQDIGLGKEYRARLDQRIRIGRTRSWSIACRRTSESMTPTSEALSLSRTALQRAGIRLAHVLNEIASGSFKPASLGVP